MRAAADGSGSAGAQIAQMLRSWCTGCPAVQFRWFARPSTGAGSSPAVGWGVGARLDAPQPTAGVSQGFRGARVRGRVEWSRPGRLGGDWRLLALDAVGGRTGHRMLRFPQRSVPRSGSGHTMLRLPRPRGPTGQTSPLRPRGRGATNGRGQRAAMGPTGPASEHGCRRFRRGSTTGAARDFDGESTTDAVRGFDRLNHRRDARVRQAQPPARRKGSTGSTTGAARGFDGLNHRRGARVRRARPPGRVDTTQPVGWFGVGPM